MNPPTTIRSPESSEAGTDCAKSPSTPSGPRDGQLQPLPDTVIREVKSYAGDQLSQIKRLIQIGLALSAERDVHKILEMIVQEARNVTHADAGTLYIVDSGEKLLRFQIIQNDSLNIRIGGTTGKEVPLPPIPLEVRGEPNYANVSSYVALTGRTVNIEDVYETEIFDFTGPKKYDASTGYRSKSMLVIPMKNHEDDIIGVLQLLNALDPETGEVIGFSQELVSLIASLASQAAVALTNAQLIQDLRNLFYSFIRSIATAIDEKSRYTGGHIRRVVDLTMMIVEAVNETRQGPLAAVHFSADEVEELRLAAWMHDVGKITTPEYVVDKSTKLQTIFDRIELLETRFDLVGKTIEEQYLLEKLQGLSREKPPAPCLEDPDSKRENALQALEQDRAFVRGCNDPDRFLSDADLERLRQIARKTYRLNGRVLPYLTEDELYNLSTRKGSLTEKERETIRQHVVMTRRILSEIPFPKKLRHVPLYAAGHHEKLDGSGYPLGLKVHQLPIQARIIAIADVFEALTARDRPYKDPLTLPQAMKVLQSMSDAGHIDPHLFQVFVDSGIHQHYADKELTSPETP